jgi:type IV pilus assembly protein PilW
MLHIKTFNLQQGLSLIELMIVMVIGLFLSLGLVNVFVASNLTYITDEESARMQENARYALRIIGRELSMSNFMAGLIGRDTLTAFPLTVDCATGNWATTLDNGGLEVVNNWQSGSPVTSVNNTLTCIDHLVVGSDIVAIKRTADEPTVENGVLNVDSVDKDQLYLRIQDYTEPAFEFLADGDSFDQLGPGFDYWKYFVKVFFVRNYSNTNADNIPSLCLATLSGTNMETNCLAEGIQAFQVEFGVDSNGDATVDYFVAAPSFTEAIQIVAIKIYVLTRSISALPNYTDDKIYTLGLTPVNGGVAFNDNYQRRIFSSTVNVRNPVTL